MVLRIIKPTIMKLTLILPLASGPLLVCGQNVTATAGGHHANGNTAVSYTIGEPVTPTLEGQAAILTQGFQQPWADISTVVEDPIMESTDIAVFPNPVDHTLHLSMGDEPTGHRFYLFDAGGRLLSEARINDLTTDIDMEPFSPGGYYLRVQDG